MSVAEMRRRIRELEKHNAATASACAMLQAEVAGRTRSLCESEERLIFALETIHTGAWTLNLADHTAFRSIEHDRIFGYAKLLPVWTYEMFLDHVLPEDRATVDRKFRQATKSQGDWNFECRIRRADGEIRWILAAGRHRRDAAGVARHMAGIVQDLTASKLAAEALHAREAQLHSFVQQAPAAIAMFDRDMNYLAVSKRWMSDYGAGRRDLAGLNHYDVHPDLPERWKEIHRKGMAGESQSSDEDQRVQANGSRVWLRWSVNPWLDALGNIGGIMILSEDITARKHAEEALRESETHYRQLIHGLPAAFFACDAKGRLTLYNAAAVALWGREPNLERDRWSGAHRLLTTDGKRIPLTRSPIALAVSQDEPIRDAALIVERPDGSRSHVLAFPDPIHDSAGTVIGAVNMLVDITELHRATAALHDSEERLRAILNTVVDAIITIDRRGTITGVNPATERMFGYSSGEMIGQNVNMLMPAPYRQEHDGYLANYERTGQARIIGIGREAQGQRKDGSVFPIDLAVSEVKDMRLFTGVIRDITDRRRLEAEVLGIGEEERLRVAADLHDGICQEIVGIQYLASLLRRDLEATRHPLAAQARRIEQAIIGTADHTRQVARGMNPVVADGSGLTHALRQLAVATWSTRHLRCTFASPAPVSIENPTVANQLYRIAQEAIHNAVRHSRAKRIALSLSEAHGEVRLTVTDNGRGLPADFSGAPGMGLRVMKYRAGLIGGQLIVQPRRRAGTEVICRVPKTSMNP